jgi:hypothetical protein
MSIENPYHPPADFTPAPISSDLRSTIDTDELDIGGIFRVTFQLFKQRPVDFGLPILIYTLVTSVLFVIYMRFFTSGFMDLISHQRKAGAATPEPFLRIFGQFFGVMMLIGFISMLLQAFYGLYITNRTGDCLINSETTAGHTFLQTMRRYVPFLFTAFLAFFPVMIGMMFCLVPGLLLMVYFSMVAPLVGIGGRGPSALSLCFPLLRDRFGKTLFVYFISLIVFYAVHMLISISLNTLIGSAFQPMDPQSVKEPQEMIRAFSESPFVMTTMQVGNFLNTLLYAYLSVVAAVMYLNYSREDRLKQVKETLSNTGIANS